MKIAITNAVINLVTFVFVFILIVGSQFHAIQFGTQHSQILPDWLIAVLCTICIAAVGIQYVNLRITWMLESMRKDVENVIGT